MSKYIKVGSIILEDKVVKDAYLEVREDGTFGEIHETVENKTDIADYSDFTLTPGLVDTHIYGLLAMM